MFTKIKEFLNSLMKQKHVFESTQLFWKTKVEKYEGILNGLRDKPDAVALVFVHFEKTLGEVMGCCQQFEIEYQLLEGREVLANLSPKSLNPQNAGQGAYLIRTEDLPEPRSDLLSPEPREQDVLHAASVEFYPLVHRDERIISFLDFLGIKGEHQLHISLEEASLLNLIPPQMMHMFEAAWKEDGPIAATAIERSLGKMQRRFEHKISGRQPADSLEEWMEKNYVG